MVDQENYLQLHVVNSFLIDILKNHIPSKGIVGVMIENIEIFKRFQDVYIQHFASNKLLKLNKVSHILDDIKTRTELQEIILTQHEKSNHRGINDVYNELRNQIYFPKLKTEIQRVINNCHICNQAKYERKPLKLPFKITETPRKPLEIVYMDIWFKIRGEYYLTIIDKFSKHAQVIPLKSRNWIDIKNSLLQYISSLGKPEKIVTDNEKSFNSVNFINYLRQENIEVHFSTIRNHTGIADIERFHNTLNEHIRIINCVQKEQGYPSDEDPVLKSVKIYNETIHSSTGKRPIDFINGKVSSDEYQLIYEKILNNKVKLITKLNENRPGGDLSNYLKLGRNQKHEPYHKKITKLAEDEDYIITDDQRKRYKNQFNRKRKYEV